MLRKPDLHAANDCYQQAKLHIQYASRVTGYAKINSLKHAKMFLAMSRYYLGII